METIISSNANQTKISRTTEGLAVFCDLEPDIEDFGDAFENGLSAAPKSLHCKFFYDKRGSELFDRICELDEYYVTRTELALLEENAGAIMRFCGPDCHLIEFGSGSSRKVRLLLDAGANVSAYTAIDISRDHLIDSCVNLAEEYPDIPVSAICADYSKPFAMPDLPLPDARKVGFFPGSSIGNFSREDAAAFLTRTATALGPGSGLIVGIDLKKDEEILRAAYNDVSGVTADFNLNLFHRARRELGIAVDMEAFEHDAVYNAEIGRIEMYLVSKKDQAFDWRGKRFEFARGERIHTENSYKYALGEIETLARDAGYRVEQSWIDSDRLFSVHFMSVPAEDRG